MTKLLKNGKIYDGAGGEPFQGDILLEDDRIAAVGPQLSASGAETIDLHGLSVSAGFFDAHSHNDWFAIRREPAKYFAPFIRQGITSFIAGNCGLRPVRYGVRKGYSVCGQSRGRLVWLFRNYWRLWNGI